MLVRITNDPRDYAWGSDALIPEFLGTPRTGEPQAELWLGAHPSCPARVDGRGLDEVLAEAGLEQPRILLKVLAAAQPLSLQAHPDATDAAAGFAREDAAGVPRDDPARTYRDPHAKPELIVAVSRFEALSGFRPIGASLRVLAALAPHAPGVEALAARAERSLREAVDWLLSDAPEVVDLLGALPAAAELLPAELAIERDTVRRISTFAPGDPAIAISLLLHRVSLEPGEALFLGAGNLHAYLEGLAIELMGPSDNVVRGGMTPKHVDRAELLRILDFTALDEPRVPAERLDGAVRWSPPAPFELRRVDGAHRIEGARQLVVLARSRVDIEVDGARLRLERGQAAYAAPVREAVVDGAEAWVALAV